jgi:hypothetical protein
MDPYYPTLIAVTALICMAPLAPLCGECWRRFRFGSVAHCAYCGSPASATVRVAGWMWRAALVCAVAAIALNDAFSTMEASYIAIMIAVGFAILTATCFAFHRCQSCRKWMTHVRGKNRPYSNEHVSCCAGCARPMKF